MDSLESLLQSQRKAYRALKTCAFDPNETELIKITLADQGETIDAIKNAFPTLEKACSELTQEMNSFSVDMPASRTSDFVNIFQQLNHKLLLQVSNLVLEAEKAKPESQNISPNKPLIFGNLSKLSARINALLKDQNPISSQTIDEIEISCTSIIAGIRNAMHFPFQAYPLPPATTEMSCEPASEGRPSFGLFPPPPAILDPMYWLYHASGCTDILCRPDCVQVKEFFCHAKRCSSCKDCNWLRRVCGLHVSECKNFNCPLEFCRKYKYLSHHQDGIDVDILRQKAILRDGETDRNRIAAIGVQYYPPEQPNSQVHKRKSAPDRPSIKRSRNTHSDYAVPMHLPEDKNEDRCHLCGLDGHLLCCDKCPKSYHLNCLGFLDAPTEDSWYCPSCSSLSPESKLQPMKKQIPVDELESQTLPAGWRICPSRSRPGKSSYENIYSKERVSKLPSKPASKSKNKNK